MRSSWDILDFPMVFFRHLWVKPISLSKNPPLHGASSRLKVHPTCRFAKYSFTVGSFNVSRIMHLADLNVLALSEISSFGRPLLETNQLKHLINDLAESSVTTSKCTARTTAQVNRQIHFLPRIIQYSDLKCPSVSETLLCLTAL